MTWSGSSRRRGPSQAEARYAAEWLEAIGAIDDADYAAVLAAPLRGAGLRPRPYAGEAAGEGRPPGAVGRGSGPRCRQRRSRSTAFCTAKLRGRAPEEAEKRRLCERPAAPGVLPGVMSGTGPAGRLGRGDQRGMTCPRRGWTGPVILMERSCRVQWSAPPHRGRLCSQSIDWRDSLVPYNGILYLPGLRQEPGELRADDGRCPGRRPHHPGTAGGGRRGGGEHLRLPAVRLRGGHRQHPGDGGAEAGRPGDRRSWSPAA